MEHHGSAAQAPQAQGKPQPRDGEPLHPQQLYPCFPGSAETRGPAAPTCAPEPAGRARGAAGKCAPAPPPGGASRQSRPRRPSHRAPRGWANPPLPRPSQRWRRSPRVCPPSRWPPALLRPGAPSGRCLPLGARPAAKGCVPGVPRGAGRRGGVAGSCSAERAAVTWRARQWPRWEQRRQDGGAAGRSGARCQRGRGRWRCRRGRFPGPGKRRSLARAAFPCRQPPAGKGRRSAAGRAVTRGGRGGSRGGSTTCAGSGPAAPAAGGGRSAGQRLLRWSRSGASFLWVEEWGARSSPAGVGCRRRGGRTTATGPAGTGGLLSVAGGDTPALASGGHGDAPRVIPPRSLHPGAALRHLRPRGAGAGAVWDTDTRRFRWQGFWVQNVAQAWRGLPRAVPRAYPREAGLYPIARGSRAGAGAGRGAAAVTGPGGPVPGLGWVRMRCCLDGERGDAAPQEGTWGHLRCAFVGIFWGKP